MSKSNWHQAINQWIPFLWCKFLHTTLSSAPVLDVPELSQEIDAAFEEAHIRKVPGPYPVANQPAAQDASMTTVTPLSQQEQQQQQQQRQQQWQQQAPPPPAYSTYSTYRSAPPAAASADQLAMALDALPPDLASPRSVSPSPEAAATVIHTSTDTSSTIPAAPYVTGRASIANKARGQSAPADTAAPPAGPRSIAPQPMTAAPSALIPPDVDLSIKVRKSRIQRRPDDVCKSPDCAGLEALCMLYIWEADDECLSERGPFEWWNSSFTTINQSGLIWQTLCSSNIVWFFLLLRSNIGF